jgi:hypothetical protein
MRKLFTRLVRRRCPICGTEVPRGSAGAVRCCGQGCCSQSHAEAYACRLYEDLADFQYRHAARHGVYVPRLMVSTMGVVVSGASGVGQERQSHCDTWFASCRVAGCL